MKILNKLRKHARRVNDTIPTEYEEDMLCLYELLAVVRKEFTLEQLSERTEYKVEEIAAALAFSESLKTTLIERNASPFGSFRSRFSRSHNYNSRLEQLRRRLFESRPSLFRRFGDSDDDDGDETQDETESS